jgi:ATP:ADP antiporter, AAA family
MRRLLNIFGDVREGETGTTVLLLANIFIVMVGSYVCKTVREPLILAGGGAELKSYAAAGQAVALMAFVPAYSWIASRVTRIKLLTGVTLFFLLNVELFWLAGRAGLPHLGIAFFVWVGVFNNAVVAQFWSYGNDLFDRLKGERLFPVIALGAALGSPVGAWFAKELFERGVRPFTVLQGAAVCLVVSMLLYWSVEFLGQRRKEAPPQRLEGRGGFALILNSPYLGMICLLFLMLNLVNTTGEYILSKAVTGHAASLVAALPAAEQDAAKDSIIGAYYGNYFFWVNILVIVLQAFVASRLVRMFGMAGALFALPCVALGAYGVLATGASLAVTRIAKTAENATDYSIMNVARQMLWLPTTRDEKYKAKQAADTFVVRAGDVMAAALVWVGTTVLGVGPREFAFANMVLVCVWLALSYLLLREYRRRATDVAEAPAA